MQDPTPSHPPCPLADVVDDLTPRQDALDWAVSELTAGRPFDDVRADLTAAGWPDPDAADLLEHARRHTRPLRGVRTRDDVVADANRTYRRAMTPAWFLGLPTLTAALRLLYALATLTTLRRRPRRHADDPSTSNPRNDNP